MHNICGGCHLYYDLTFTDTTAQRTIKTKTNKYMLLNISTLLLLNVKLNYGGDYLNLSYVTHGTV